MRNIDEIWKGTDNGSRLMRFKKRIQYWLAVGPLGTHWHCKDRRLPTALVIYGGGKLRYETGDGKQKFVHPYPDTYLSRIQPWCRWHLAIQRPPFITGHIFWSKKDVQFYPDYKSDFGFKKLFNFYFGYGRDDQPFYYPKTTVNGNME